MKMIPANRINVIGGKLKNNVSIGLVVSVDRNTNLMQAFLRVYENGDLVEKISLNCAFRSLKKYSSVQLKYGEVLEMMSSFETSGCILLEDHILESILVRDMNYLNLRLRWDSKWVFFEGHILFRSERGYPGNSMESDLDTSEIENSPEERSWVENFFEFKD